MTTTRHPIHVWSRRQVENIGRFLALDPGDVLISITTPGRDPLALEYSDRWRRVLRLSFHDATPLEIQHHPYSWEDAARVLTFANENLHCAWHIYCDEGMSRSTAIGGVLAEVHDRELKLHDRAADEFTNGHVIRVTREAAARGRSKW